MIDELTTIIKTENGEKIELKISHQYDDVIDFYVDDKFIGHADWIGNIQTLFFKSLQKWGKID